jgi:hypothetical protein
MRRIALVVVCLALAGPLLADKPEAPAVQLPLAASTINGSPLTIVVGDNTSMQVYNTNVPGTGQFYPPGSQPGYAGIYVRPAGGVTYGPCCGASQPYNLVSLSPVTGTGTALDPFTVVVVVDIPTTSVQMTETLTYVNGASAANISLSFVGDGNPVVVLDAFIGADLYLAGNDRGFSFAGPTAAGGRAADTNCAQLQYTISFLGTTPADRYSANGYSQIWSEISAGSLSNTFNPTCIDNGASLQWTNRSVGTTPVVINTAASFTGQAVPVQAEVPTLSTIGIAAFVVLLALVGYVLARKSSLGA